MSGSIYTCIVFLRKLWNSPTLHPHPQKRGGGGRVHVHVVPSSVQRLPTVEKHEHQLLTIHLRIEKSQGGGYDYYTVLSILQKMYTPFLVYPFQPQLVFD